MRLLEVVDRILSGLSTSPMDKAHKESDTGEVDLGQLKRYLSS